MRTDFLFVQPSLSGGVASAIDFEGLNFYNLSATDNEADDRALRSDWSMVGCD
jgi:hypothetical protein